MATIEDVYKRQGHKCDDARDSGGKNDLAQGYVSHAPLLPSGSGGSLVVPPD